MLFSGYSPGLRSGLFLLLLEFIKCIRSFNVTQWLYLGTLIKVKQADLAISSLCT